MYVSIIGATISGVGVNVIKTTFGGLAVRGLTRLLPVIGWLQTAWDLYQLVQWLARLRNLEGWELLIECPTGGVGQLSPGNAGLCGVNPAHQSEWQEPQNQYTDFDQLPNSFGHENWLGVRSFHRVTPGAQPYFPARPVPDMQYEPMVNLPAVDPMVQPVEALQPPPVPIPWVLIPYFGPNPYRVDQREVGYGVRPGYEVAYPSVQTDVTPSAPPTHTNVPYWPQPPKPGVRERKQKMTLNGTGLGLVINTITESTDFINALWKSLPLEFRSKGFVTIWDKIADLWEHLGEIDGRELGLRLLIEMLEDKTYGTLQPKHLHHWPSVRGPGLHPHAQPPTLGLPSVDPWEVPEIINSHNMKRKGK